MKFVEKSWRAARGPFESGGRRGGGGAGACTASMRACVRVYTRCDAMCDEAAMCKNCECDVDGSDGEPMPHIRYAHSEPRGCDVTSGLHAPGSYPPVRSPTVSDLREPSTTRADPLSSSLFSFLLLIDLSLHSLETIEFMGPLIGGVS